MPFFGLVAAVLLLGMAWQVSSTAQEPPAPAAFSGAPRDVAPDTLSMLVASTAARAPRRTAPRARRGAAKLPDRKDILAAGI
ncbi:MAG TPA: hypothetical protein VLT33_17735 [Labilithrix sp.]|nr:hypothetical protein [Labilithrix sp.]